MHIESLEGRRLMAAAGLDPTFGTGGIVTTRLGEDVEVSAQATQADGKVVVVGYTHRADGPTGRDFVVARLNADGSLDATFGTCGVTVTDVAPSSAVAHRLSPSQDEAAAVAIEPDGGIILVGTSRYVNDSAGDVVSRPIVARYTTAGQLDPSFGAADRAFLGLPAGVSSAVPSYGGVILQVGSATSVLIDTTGDIVVGGSTDPGVDRASDGTSDAHYLFSWLTPDGTAATRPGNGFPTGTDEVYVGVGHNPVTAILPLSDGGYVAVGSFNVGREQFAPPYGFGVVRFDAAGTPSTLTVASLPVPSGINAVAPTAATVTADGKLVVTGIALSGRTRATARTSAIIVRYTDATGTAVDPTFGTDGVVRVSIARETAAVNVATAADGSMAALIGGTANLTDAGESDYVYELTSAGAVTGRVQVKLPHSSAAGTGDGRYGTLSPARPGVSIDAVGRATVYTSGRSAIYQLRTARAGVDLAVGTLAVPNVAHAGRGSTVVTLSLADLGQQAARGSATVRLTVTPAAGGDAIVLDLPLKLNVTAGQAVRTRLTFRLPAGLAAGQYDVAGQLLPSKLGDVDPINDTSATAVLTVA